MMESQSSKPSGKVYVRTNGCTQKPSFQQVLAFLLVLTVIVLHSVLVPTICQLKSTLLIVLLAFTYLFLAVATVDYVILLVLDPVDPRLVEANYKQKREEDKELLVHCMICEKNVHVYSFHCRKCRRCVEEFDHHCVFLNNCIGRQNYTYFFRLLLTLSCFLVFNFGQGLWVYLQNEDKYRWVGLALAIFCALIFPEVIGLAVFHCYISFFLYKTTLQVIRGQLKPNEIADIQENNPRKMKQNEKRGSPKAIVFDTGATTESNIKREQMF